MLTLDSFYQNVEWRHDQIDESEPYEHEGSLVTYVLLPKITIGLSAWWNITIEKYIGHRQMDWYRDEISAHHREEGSHSNFANAKGGLLGDTKLNLKFLLFNEGRGQGIRMFLGGGVVLPSKNQLTVSPFLKDENDSYYEHRHFSIGTGVYRANVNVQSFYKRKINPVFFGISLNIDEPIKNSKYGFSGSRLYKVAFSTLFNKNNPINRPISISCVISHNGKAFWNDVLAPNSESTIITPGIGILGSLGSISYSINFQKPIFLDIFLPESGNTLNQKAEAWQLSLSIRRVLDYYIPWLYW